MEQAKTPEGIPPRLRDYFFQVVVKFQNDESLFDHRQDGDIDFALLDNIISWTQFQKSIPKIKIHRLFTSLSADEINSWSETAICSDSSYTPPNFFSYYVIGVPSEFYARTVWQRLVNNTNVEWAYVVNDSTPPNAPTIEPELMEIKQE